MTAIRLLYSALYARPRNHIFTMATDLLFGYAPVREISQSDSDETEISELAEFWWSYANVAT